jgi:hypothetical protein
MNMNVAEIKSDLHRMVVETDDMNLLEKVRKIFAILKTDTVDWADMLTPEQMRMIEKGLDDIEKGNFVSDEDVRSGVDSILKRK